MAFVMIFLWVPETKQRTLEELDYICKWTLENSDLKPSTNSEYTVGVPTRRHMQYQVTEVLPYVFRRYFLRKDAELRPLYRFQNSY